MTNYELVSGGDMAHSKFYLICGNCGCDDLWIWDFQHGEASKSEIISEPDVFITCGNCATLHILSDKAKQSEL